MEFRRQFREVCNAVSRIFFDGRFRQSEETDITTFSKPFMKEQKTVSCPFFLSSHRIATHPYGSGFLFSTSFDERSAYGFMNGMIFVSFVCAVLTLEWLFGNRPLKLSYMSNFSASSDLELGDIDKLLTSCCSYIFTDCAEETP